jgi:hypothetical protein
MIFVSHQSPNLDDTITIYHDTLNRKRSARIFCFLLKPDRVLGTPVGLGGHEDKVPT